MKWFKFETQEEEIAESENSPILVYLSPEALKHAFVVDDFNSFQDTPECVPGGKFFEVSRQYSFKLRQVADLVEEPLEEEKLLKNSLKRNFHEEIRPEKKLFDNNENELDLLNQEVSFKEESTSEIDSDVDRNFNDNEKLNTDQVPFKDLESLFAK